MDNSPPLILYTRLKVLHRLESPVEGYQKAIGTVMQFLKCLTGLPIMRLSGVIGVSTGLAARDRKL